MLSNGDLYLLAHRTFTVPTWRNMSSRNCVFLVEYCIALLANAKAHFVNSVTANCCQRRCGCRSCVARQQIIDERQRYFILNSIFAKFITQSGATLQKAADEFFTY